MMKKLRLKEAVVVEGRYDRQRLGELIESSIIETGGFRVFKDREKQHLLKTAAEKSGLIILTDSDAAGFVIRNYLKSFIPQKNIKNAYIPEILGKEKRKPAPSKEGKLGVEGVSPDVLKAALIRAGATILSDVGEEEPSSETQSDTIQPVILSEGGNAAEVERSFSEKKPCHPENQACHPEQGEGSLDSGAGDPPSTINQSSIINHLNITKFDLYDLGLLGRENAKEKRDALLSDLGYPRYLSTNALLEALNATFTRDEFLDFMGRHQ